MFLNTSESIDAIQWIIELRMAIKNSIDFPIYSGSVWNAAITTAKTPTAIIRPSNGRINKLVKKNNPGN